ncbi:hypothetical protein HanHA300_Chr13g0475451 [Helianthus annuus]|nr:hypothetical protein HanHA300_Chr13g0475451 [Helianthus annuus]
MIIHITTKKKKKKKNFFLSPFLDLRPRAFTTFHPLSIFDFPILHTTKCARAHTRRSGAYGITRTSPQRY